jgi:hypothetical protein
VDPPFLETSEGGFALTCEPAAVPPTESCAKTQEPRKKSWLGKHQKVEMRLQTGVNTGLEHNKRCGKPMVPLGFNDPTKMVEFSTSNVILQECGHQAYGDLLEFWSGRDGTSENIWKGGAPPVCLLVYNPSVSTSFGIHHEA